MEDYYEDKAERMILRDHLAADRTQLANEKTLLAYYRTKRPLDNLRERAVFFGGPQTSQTDTDSHSV